MKGQSEAGKLIYQYTYNKNVSITELAASMKISYAHLSNMLRGNKRINNNQLQKICNILNLNREERAKLREAVFISNPSIIISTKDKRLYILRFLYLLIQKAPSLSQAQIDECKKIIQSNPQKDEQKIVKQENKEPNNKNFNNKNPQPQMNSETHFKQ